MSCAIKGCLSRVDMSMVSTNRIEHNPKILEAISGSDCLTIDEDVYQAAINEDLTIPVLNMLIRGMVENCDERFWR